MGPTAGGEWLTTRAAPHTANVGAFDTAGDAVVVKPMMYVAVSYDHRIVDGREAVQFLVRVKECLETPDRILLEV